jgi:hypothetical protein
MIPLPATTYPAAPSVLTTPSKGNAIERASVTSYATIVPEI